MQRFSADATIFIFFLANKKLKKTPSEILKGNNFISVLYHHDLFVAKLRCAWNYEKTAEDFLLLLHLLYQFTREDRRTFMSELRL